MTYRKVFIRLALRNEELLELNDQLKQQLDEVLNELNAVKKNDKIKLYREKNGPS
jgi:hypothetical protein